MAIYIVILGMLGLFGLSDVINIRRYQKLVLVFIAFMLFVTVDGLRWETGTDWSLYKAFFQNSARESWMAFEPGYVFLNQLVHLISENYSVFLIFIATIFYSLYLKSIYEYSLFPLITVLLFFAYFLGYMGMSRQHLALAICLFAYRYIVSKEFLKFLFYVLIAALFHKSAFIFLIAYFLNRTFPAHLFLISLLVVYFMNPFIAGLIKPVVSAFPDYIEYKLNFYLNDAGTNSTLGTILGTLKRIFVFLPLYLYRDKLKEKFPQAELMLNIYFFSLLFYVLFNNSVQVFVGRGNLYFGTLFEIFLIPLFLLLFKRNAGLLIVYVLLIAFAGITMLKSISGYYDIFVPYKGLFINSDLFRVIY